MVSHGLDQHGKVLLVVSVSFKSSADVPFSEYFGQLGRAS